jgi:hypothetical protein
MITVSNKLGAQYACCSGWKTLRKETLGRPRCRWEGNIDIDLKGECMEWIYLAQGRDNLRDRF